MGKLRVKVKDIEIEMEQFGASSSMGEIKELTDYLVKAQKSLDKGNEK